MPYSEYCGVMPQEARMRMFNETTWKLLEEELPWVRSVIPKDTRGYEVKIMDLDTLSLVAPVHHDIHGYCNAAGKLLLMTEFEGEDAYWVGYKEEMVWERSLFSWPPFKMVQYVRTKFFPESVEHALHRYSYVANHFRFIVDVRDDYATIYKLPKGYTDMLGYIEWKGKEEASRIHRVLES